MRMISKSTAASRSSPSSSVAPYGKARTVFFVCVALEILERRERKKSVSEKRNRNRKTFFRRRRRKKQQASFFLSQKTSHPSPRRRPGPPVAPVAAHILPDPRVLFRLRGKERAVEVRDERRRAVGSGRGGTKLDVILEQAVFFVFIADCIVHVAVVDDGRWADHAVASERDNLAPLGLRGAARGRARELVDEREAE